MMRRTNSKAVCALMCAGGVISMWASLSRAGDPKEGVGSKPEAVSKADAAAVFERMKKLDGLWEGKSTKGWTEKSRYSVIAKGSVVMDLSEDAHPNEKMVTMFYMDGDRLLLTHYCVARNQPRLCATEVSDGGKRVTFTFLDATNLPSRDKGHMDKCVLNFIDDDHFTQRWTWYQDGKEDWMEEITLRRVPEPASAGKS